MVHLHHLNFKITKVDHSLVLFWAMFLNLWSADKYYIHFFFWLNLFFISSCILKLNLEPSQDPTKQNTNSWNGWAGLQVLMECLSVCAAIASPPGVFSSSTIALALFGRLSLLAARSANIWAFRISNWARSSGWKKTKGKELFCSTHVYSTETSKPFSLDSAEVECYRQLLFPLAVIQELFSLFFPSQCEIKLLQCLGNWNRITQNASVAAVVMQNWNSWSNSTHSDYVFSPVGSETTLSETEQVCWNHLAASGLHSTTHTQESKCYWRQNSFQLVH